MRRFRIPFTWQKKDYVHVDAASLEDAERRAKEDFESRAKTYFGVYIKGSFQLDKDDPQYPIDDPSKITRDEYKDLVCKELEKLTGISPIGDWHVPGFDMDEFLVLGEDDVVHTDSEPVVLYSEGNDIVGITTTDYLTKATNIVENLGLTVIEEE